MVQEKHKCNPKRGFITKKRAIDLAKSWSYSQDSALSAFVETKWYCKEMHDDYISEIKACFAVTVQAKEEIKSLERYFEYEKFKKG